MEPKEKDQSTEKSLKYIAWSFKELVIELKSINQSLADLKNLLENNDKMF